MQGLSKHNYNVTLMYEKEPDLGARRLFLAVEVPAIDQRERHEPHLQLFARARPLRSAEYQIALPVYGDAMARSMRASPTG